MGRRGRRLSIRRFSSNFSSNSSTSAASTCTQSSGSSGSKDAEIVEENCDEVAKWLVKHLTTLKIVDETDTKFGEQVLVKDFRNFLNESPGFSGEQRQILLSIFGWKLKEMNGNSLETTPESWHKLLQGWFRIVNLSESLSEVEFGINFFSSPSQAAVKVINESNLSSILSLYHQSNLDALLSVDQVKYAFKQFLLDRHCNENFDCYEELNKITANSPKVVLSEFAAKFISEGSSHQVNISHELRSEVRNCIALMCQSTHDKLREQELNLILSKLKQALRTLIVQDAMSQFIAKESSWESASRMVSSTYGELGGGKVFMSPPAFKKFTRRNPILLSYFSNLQIALNHLLEFTKVKIKESRQTEGLETLVALLEASELEEEFESSLVC